jgi:alkylation response protein AidB-like acyl-CoA dehydrogenase
MEFTFSEEQNLLRESVRKFVEDNYQLEPRLKLAGEGEGFSREHWKLFAELGWLAVPFSEDDGGIDGTAVETSVIMEEFGKGLVLEPYLATIVMAGTALRLAANAQQKEQYIGSIIEGNTFAAFANVEKAARYNLNFIETSAKKDGDNFVINGTKSMVYSANVADIIIIAARTSGEKSDNKGISLFIVPADSEGLSLENYPTVDGYQASEVTLENVKVPAANLLGEQENGLDIIKSVMDEALVAVCSEAVGAMELLYKDTVEYTKQRVQFDHVLSDFQVLKHRMVDMFIETEQSRSLLMKATQEMADGNENARKTIHGLKVMIGSAGKFVGQNAVQLHGGMGVTEELRVGHYFKRLTVINSLFGNDDYHLNEFINY